MGRRLRDTFPTVGVDLSLPTRDLKFLYSTNWGAFGCTFGCSRRFHEMEGVHVTRHEADESPGTRCSKVLFHPEHRTLAGSGTTIESWGLILLFVHRPL